MKSRPKEKSYSPREAALFLGMSFTPIYNKIYLGQLPATRKGREWHIPESALIALRRQREEESQAVPA